MIWHSSIILLKGVTVVLTSSRKEKNNALTEVKIARNLIHSLGIGAQRKFQWKIQNE